MKQTVSVKELKVEVTHAFPRLFIDLLLQDYYPKNKTRLKIGVFIYIFGKLANKPLQLSIRRRQAGIYLRGAVHHPYHDHGPGHWMFLIYAARKALNELAEENMIHKIKAGNGLAIKVPFYKSLFIKEEKIQKDNDKQEQE